jgi:hypothetical protein
MVLLCFCCCKLYATPGHLFANALKIIHSSNDYFSWNHSFYLDGVNGNDANDGRTPQTAVKTVTRLLSLGIESGDVIFVARGSRFREFLNIKDLRISNITIMDYGNGPRPVFDAADSAQNNLFTKKAGYQNLYDISWKNNFRDNTDVSQYSVWEDGLRLKRASSLQDCDNTPGSYYAPVVTQPAGTDIITVHASNSEAIPSNKRLYEIARRSMGIQVGDNSRVYNMHTRRNASNNGSFEAGHGCYIYGVLAEDGVKHNFFIGSGTAEKCMAWKSDDPVIFGGNTLFISFTDSPAADTMDVLFKDCIAIAGRNTTDQFQYGAIGLYEHTTGVPYRSFQVKGGIFANTSVGVSCELKDLSIDGAFFINNVVASSKVGGSITLKNSHIILARADAAAISGDNELDSVVFVNNKVYMPGAGQMVAKMPIAAPKLIRFTDNTVVCNCENNFNVVYYNSGGGDLIMERNLAANLNTGPVIGFATLDPFSATTIASGNNHYATQQDGSHLLKIIWTGPTVNYTTLDQIKAAGYESGSSGEPSNTLESRINGTYSTTDFFLSKSDVLYNKCGSSSTFDDTVRYPYWLGDTLGVVLKDSISNTRFLSFSGITSNLGNQLTWQVATTDSLLYFEVEFSTDGTNFSSLGKIQYEQDKQQYQYLHSQPPQANDYYRISATSRNGAKFYSEQLLLRPGVTGSVQVGPNPVNQVLHITVNLPSAGNANIKVLSADGKVVKVLQSRLTGGNQSLNLNFSGMLPGLYYVEIATPARYVFKVMKL